MITVREIFLKERVELFLQVTIKHQNIFFKSGT